MFQCFTFRLYPNKDAICETGLAESWCVTLHWIKNGNNNWIPLVIKCLESPSKGMIQNKTKKKSPSVILAVNPKSWTLNVVSSLAGLWTMTLFGERSKIPVELRLEKQNNKRQKNSEKKRWLMPQWTICSVLCSPDV